MKTKKQLRKEYLNIRNSMTRENIIHNSNVIINKLVNMKAYKETETIITYVNFGSEVNTKDFIKYALNDNKMVYVPLTDKQNKQLIFYELNDIHNDLEEGIYGILEPKKNLNKMPQNMNPDMVLVPGLLFSVDGFRIGYGGGYYDRYLRMIDNTSKKIGLAFDFQVQDNVPISDYDEKVDVIITEKKTMKCIGNE